jgi:hypothetical protein
MKPFRFGIFISGSDCAVAAEEHIIHCVVER